MLKELSLWESGLFFFINGHHFALLDPIMWTFSSKLIWLPMIFAVLFYGYCKENAKLWLADLLLIVLLLTLCDQISSSIMKHYFLRLRPSHDPSFAPFIKLLYGYAGGMYGFPSSHATNSFGVAFFTTKIIQDRRFSFFSYLYASIICYSRIYLGVHFPSDIVMGALTGIACACVVLRVYVYVLKLYDTRKLHLCKKTTFLFEKRQIV